jgi:hypothetical protein
LCRVAHAINSRNRPSKYHGSLTAAWHSASSLLRTVTSRNKDIAFRYHRHPSMVFAPFRPKERDKPNPAAFELAKARIGIKPVT